MKRLRKAYPQKIRFYACGEYGEICKKCGKPQQGTRRCLCHIFSPSLGRPHFHALLFNIRFKDRELWATQNGEKLYYSKTLEEIWGNGFTLTGEVNHKSSAYVARYILKKMTGEKAKNWYQGKKPEFVTMSRGGKSPEGKNLKGIGNTWYQKYKESAFPHNYVIIDGQKRKTPSYYKNILKEEEYDKYVDVLEDTLARVERKPEEFTHEARLRKEKYTRLVTERLIRPMETR